uniref:Bestrophin homolog n=1 Tax=Plectus sambesii TaxID=2011161 RepID=A0A914WE69_9BILA
MTIKYADDVPKSNTWQYFKLLFRWKASLWQAIWGELLLWLIIYTLLSLLYRLALSDDQKTTFEKVVQFWAQYTGNDFVPLTFILGFFVSLVVGRWWDMLMCIGDTETVATLLASYIEGNDEDIMILKRNVIRYMVLTKAMVFQDISGAFRKRYPDMEALIKAGFINETELQMMKSLPTSNPSWMPIYWAMTLIKEAKRNGRVECDSDSYVIDLYEKLRDYKGGLGKLGKFMNIPIPLAYTQVVFVAVRLYFSIALLANQYLDPDRVKNAATSDVNVQFGVDLYFPFATVIQFIFYVGWAKVAESLFNPLGGDDDDFEVEAMVTGNLQSGLMIVDAAYDKMPDQFRDPFLSTGIDAPFAPEQQKSGFGAPITAFKRRANKIQSSIISMPSKSSAKRPLPQPEIVSELEDHHIPRKY